MSTNEIPLTPDGELRIRFDKESGDITIDTAGGNRLVLSDKNNEIIIKDVNANTIRMSSEGISLQSDKNISIHAGQSVSIVGNSGITLQADGGDVTVKAMNIKENALMHYSAKGNMTADVSGGAELSLKAAMIMIN